MNITKEMAVTSLRPNLNAWETHGNLSDQDIEREKNRLKLLSESDQKKLYRIVHQVDVHDLADLVEQLTNRVSTLEKRPK